MTLAAFLTTLAGVVAAVAIAVLALLKYLSQRDKQIAAQTAFTSV